MEPNLTPYKALLVGINRYPLFPTQNQLLGCHNDVALFGEFLIHAWGFPPEQICRLLDEAATKQAIWDELGRLAEGATAGSWVVFYFSGHGSRMKDVGAGSGDEDDGWDETLVPYDSGRKPHINLDLTDDQIRFQLDRIQATGASILFVVDACRSGTIFRDDLLATIRQVVAEEQPVRPSSTPLEFKDVEVRRGALWTLAACEDRQGAYELEIGGNRQGAFTYHLIQALKRLKRQGTWAELREQTLIRLLGGISNQWPRFTGPLGAEVPIRHRHVLPSPVSPQQARLQLRIDLPAAEAEPVRAFLVDSPWLEEAPPRSLAWASLGYWQNPTETGPGLAVQVLARAGGEVLMEGERLDPAEVVSTLENWARFNFVRWLDEPGTVDVEGLEIELLRQRPGHGWIPAAESEQLPIYENGERFGSRIRNGTAEAVFLAVFLLTAGAALKPLFPLSGPARRLPAGDRLEIGLGLDLRIVLKSEDARHNENTEVDGIEQVLVLAAPQPWDWSSWLADLFSGPPSGPALASKTSSFRLVAR